MSLGTQLWKKRPDFHVLLLRARMSADGWRAVVWALGGIALDRHIGSQTFLPLLNTPMNVENPQTN